MTGLRFLNFQTLRKLAVLTVLMFGFGYAMVPLYKKLCEVTGLNFLTKPDQDIKSFLKNTQVDTTRKVTVEFDANSRGPWGFKPEKAHIEVRPGELTTMVYTLKNNLDRQTVGQAIPSYAPRHSAQHFKKIECFCFKQQALESKQVREFPVVFVVDPNLPKDVTTITLSYTFFEVGGLKDATKTSAAPSTQKQGG
jgi:cytochrome c oxidase assembly protein subunit 11